MKKPTRLDKYFFARKTLPCEVLLMTQNGDFCDAYGVDAWTLAGLTDLKPEEEAPGLWVVRFPFHALRRYSDEVATSGRYTLLYAKS